MSNTKDIIEFEDTEEKVDYAKFLDDDLSSDSTLDLEISSDGVFEFCERLSGRSTYLENNAKSSICYQLYCGEKDEPKIDDDASIIYELQANTYAVLSYDTFIPDIIKLDIVFPTFDSPDIKLMWARIQKFIEAGSKTHEADPLFIISLIENEPISMADTNEEVDKCLTAFLFNPIMATLTRQIPTDPAIEITNSQGETIGGNIIRMIFASNLVDFKLDNFNIADEKATAEREELYG